MSQQLIALTTVRQGIGQNPVEAVRSGVFLDTAKQCSELGIPLLAVYVECSDSYLTSLQNLQVQLVEQDTSGMGAVRRQAIQSALAHFPWAKYFLWTEPEKPSLPALAQEIINQLVEPVDLCLFNRTRMDSYPEEQAHYYLFCRAIASKLLGFDLDYGFGPMVFTHNTAPYFLEYDGEYGDLWDSILVPRLRILRSRLPFSVQLIDFKNDRRMTDVETGNPDIALKRIEQFKNVIPSFIAEWQKGDQLVQQH